MPPPHFPRVGSQVSTAGEMVLVGESDTLPASNSGRTGTRRADAGCRDVCCCASDLLSPATSLSCSASLLFSLNCRVSSCLRRDSSCGFVCVCGVRCACACACACARGGCVCVCLCVRAASREGGVPCRTLSTVWTFEIAAWAGCEFERVKRTSFPSECASGAGGEDTYRQRRHGSEVQLFQFARRHCERVNFDASATLQAFDTLTTTHK